MPCLGASSAPPPGFAFPAGCRIGGCAGSFPALLVLNKEGSLAIVDPAARKVLGAVRTGDTPHEVAVSSDGQLAFVANYGGLTPGNTISVIDLAARNELRRVDLGSLRRPHGLAFDGGKLYFTAEVNKLIGRYDPAANRIDWLLAISGRRQRGGRDRPEDPGAGRPHQNRRRARRDGLGEIGIARALALR